MSLNPTRVNMLILMQHDLEKAVEFYKKMGFHLIFHIKGKWAEFLLGDIKIGLAPVQEQLPLHRTGIVLQVNDLKSSYDHFKQKGVEFIREPVEALHGLMASFKDPGNSIIDLYQPTPEKVREYMEKKQKEESSLRQGSGGQGEEKGEA